MDEPIKLVWHGRLPGLNEMVNANRTCWQIGAKIKKSDQEELAMVFRSQAKGKKMEAHATAYIRFYEKDKRRDDDNVIGGGCKLVMDALTKAGIIQDDSPKWLHVRPERFTLEGTRAERERGARIEIDLLPEGYAGNVVYAVCNDRYLPCSLWSHFEEACIDADRRAKRGEYYWVDRYNLDDRDSGSRKILYEAGERPVWM